jgi:hypothetical protein
VGRLLLIVVLAYLAVGRAIASPTQNFVFFDLDRDRIHDASFLNTKALVGAQLKYTWRELEPRRGVYDFHAITQDLAFLHAHGKKLFIQLQDVTFDPRVWYVPVYIKSDPEYHGGADEQYDIPGDNEAGATPEGWVARRWDPAVADRFHKLLFALGKELDGRIDGINLPETSLDFGDSGRLFPPGFTPAVYRDAIVGNMAALRRAFPSTTVLIYANFMPGEWLPDDDKGLLKSVYAAAWKLKVGVGGPDMIPYRPGQMHHSYPLIAASHGRVPSGIAVQDNDYLVTNPATGRPMSIDEEYRFGTTYLKVDYLFWCTQEPYYSKWLIPFMNSKRWQARS